MTIHTLLKIISAVSLLTFISINCSELSNKLQAKAINDSLITITISAVGDLMCHSVQYNYAKVVQDSFDFTPVYREVRDYLSGSDFTFGNLETVAAGSREGYSGYPFFNSPDDFISALKETGFDLLTTTNNHSLDKGEKGLLRTIDVINKNGLHYNGTFISQKDRDSIRIFNIKGINVAFLAYTYGTNGIPVPHGKNFLINLIDYSSIKKDISRAKDRADIILVHYHFGEEYSREPSEYQNDVTDSTIKYGADIVIGGHPHVIQTSKYFKTKNGNINTGFIAYSLGNFISNQQWRYSDAGVILNLSITKNIYSDSLYLSDINFIPTWVFKGKTSKGNEYLILPSAKYNDSLYSFLSGTDKRKMKEAFEDTKYILSKLEPDIKVRTVK
jgi:poly-gamma-glutamate synthesis protein (capsule biosynthesis protein)